MRIIGHIVCQNGVGEIMRTIDSMYPVVDEIYVLDGGSTDGTLNVLNRFKKSYNITIFNNPFERLDKQRNLLLEKTEPDCWIINIDQDEKLSSLATKDLREFIGRIDKRSYNSEYPLTIALPLINLNKTPLSMREDTRYNTNKIFYYKKGLKFVEPYHCHIEYENQTHTDNYEQVNAPIGMAVLHYARLDQKRYDSWDIEKSRRDCTWEDWDPEFTTIELDKIWW